MIVQFEDDYLEGLYQGKAFKRKTGYDNVVLRKFIKVVQKLKFIDNINELRNQRGLNFEALKGNLKGKYSVRVDIKYRLIFRIEKNGSMVIENVIVIEDLSNHYQ